MLITLYSDVNNFVKIIKKTNFVNTKHMTTITEYANPIEQTFNLDEIVSYALQQEFVLGARAFEYNETIVLALLTTPFCLKSERDNAKLTIYESLQNTLCDKKLVLTFDMQVYRNIKNDLDDQSKEFLLELAELR